LKRESKVLEIVKREGDITSGVHSFIAALFTNAVSSR
jgi:hypothetical protein